MSSFQGYTFLCSWNMRRCNIFTHDGFTSLSPLSSLSLFLSLAPAESAALAPTDQGLLIDVFGGPPPPVPAPALVAAAEVTTPPTAMGLSPGAEEGFMRFLLKNNGVLFENEILHIGVKSEYKKNLG